MKRTLLVIMLLATLVSLGLFGARWAVEYPNNSVEIVYDLPALITLSQVTEIPLENLFSDLKDAGVKTIAVEPENIGEWFVQAKPLPNAIKTQLPEKTVNLARFLSFPVSFQEQQIKAVLKAGLQVAPKLNTVPWEIEPLWVSAQPQLLILSGQGEFSQEQLHGSQARLALVEFSSPQTSQLDAIDRMVRLHGISAPEMRVLSEERILNRYVRAVRERNIRVLYVRPFVEGDQCWQRSLELLSNLESRLKNEGFHLGTAVPFSFWKPAPIWTLIVGAGIWAAAILYGSSIFPRWAKLVACGGFLGWLATLGLISLVPSLAQQGLALLAAIVFPCLALGIRRGSSPLQNYWLTAGVSVLGALFVVASLTGTEYLLKIQEFRGVKLMHMVPIALVVFTLIRPLKAWFNKDVPIRYLFWLGVVGLIGALYILRTGNFGLPVSTWEIKAREFLENLLRTRPRTKEFLVGHPALYWALQNEEPYKSWWLPIAVIGQVSLINTFTHIHTALWVSVLRTIYGLIFGYCIGWLLLRIYTRGKRWLQSDHGLGILRVR